MREEIATAWADRLESGKEEQGRFALARDGKFCCLGVLCEMAVEAGIITKTVNDNDKGTTYYGPSEAVLPSAVMEWADIRTASGMFLDGTYGNSCLSAMNDRHDFTFAQIAVIIRANYQYL